MVTHSWNSKRFEQKPIRQPSYWFRNVPKCARNLKGSSLQRLTDRTHFQESTAEMVLLCNEATRRSVSRNSASKGGKEKKRSSVKPLSLEYIADRLDVDDPIFGYLVRCPEGRLQGFVTITTFTNWQKSFRWDSMHESAYAYDDEEQGKKQKKGIRLFDKRGELAEALESTIRCGDIWNEGIVWPKIAEISLLGGLGCGKTLVSLAIEELECLKPSANQNYDYVALQATDNSIPFYESLGFVRVGAVTEDENYEKKIRRKRNLDNESIPSSEIEEPKNASPPSRTNSSEEKEERSEIVSSSIYAYKTKKAGETPKDIAKELNVDVWDIIFLNPFYDTFSPTCRLKKGTTLHIPCLEKAAIKATSHAVRFSKMNAAEKPETPLWYIAKENDTPRSISVRFSLDWKDIVHGNKSRFPDLLSNSRLRAGTRIKVSHFDVPDEKHVPYCHWTFPDDKFESCEPSYMMVRKLNRCVGKEKEFLSSLAVPISSFQPSPMLLPAEKNQGKKKSEYKGPHPDEPKEPAKPASAYMMFYNKHSDLLKNHDAGNTSNADIKKALGIAWKELPEGEKILYKTAARKAKEVYANTRDLYDLEIAKFKAEHPDHYPPQADENNLFCQVVRLDSGAGIEELEYKYWFVLTFIVDLKWCHLAPMVQVGTCAPEKPFRPKWELVDESSGKELDITSRFCIPVASRMMKNCDDADCEEWDILEVPSVTPPQLPAVLPVSKKKKIRAKKKPCSTISETSNGIATKSADATNSNIRKICSQNLEKKKLVDQPVSIVPITVDPPYVTPMAAAQLPSFSQSFCEQNIATFSAQVSTAQGDSNSGIADYIPEYLRHVSSDSPEHEGIGLPPFHEHALRNDNNDIIPMGCQPSAHSAANPFSGNLNTSKVKYDSMEYNREYSQTGFLNISTPVESNYNWRGATNELPIGSNHPGNWSAGMPNNFLMAQQQHLLKKNNNHSHLKQGYWDQQNTRMIPQTGLSAEIRGFGPNQYSNFVSSSENNSTETDTSAVSILHQQQFQNGDSRNSFLEKASYGGYNPVGMGGLPHSFDVTNSLHSDNQRNFTISEDNPIAMASTTKMKRKTLPDSFLNDPFFSGTKSRKVNTGGFMNGLQKSNM